MAKKRGQKVAGAVKKQQDDKVTLADQLNDNVLAQLAAAKKDLVAKEKVQEEQMAEQRRKECKEREKNKTFEELLNEYGDQGSKF